MATALPASPPRYESWAHMLRPIKRGASGWPAYALQAGIGMATADRDGVFGSITEQRLKEWQARRSLTADGIAGPATQRAILHVQAAALEGQRPELPHGLLRGMVEGEGASILAATNWYTPPDGRPGVDCGAIQWRQYGPPFGLAALRAAFDPRQSLGHAADVLLSRWRSYAQRGPAGYSMAFWLRAAVLAHNAPFLAEQLVRTGKLSTPTAQAVWTSKPGGGHYTHAEWARVYPETILRYVAGA